MSGEADTYCPVYEERIRRARKDHQCDGCTETIRAGDFYSYTFAVVEGDPTTVRRCGRCQKTFEHLTAVCQAHNKRTGDCLAPQWDLGCGLRYEDEWGPVPDEIARLPFLTDDEASALLEPRVAGRGGGET